MVAVAAIFYREFILCICTMHFYLLKQIMKKKSVSQIPSEVIENTGLTEPPHELYSMISNLDPSQFITFDFSTQIFFLQESNNKLHIKKAANHCSHIGISIVAKRKSSSL